MPIVAQKDNNAQKIMFINVGYEKIQITDKMDPYSTILS